MTTRREINEYLAAEWGEDFERATDDRPFRLTELGDLGLPDERVPIYSFTAREEAYFAFGGRHLRVLPAHGMTLDDLRLQEIGRDWIAAGDPVDAATSRIGDDGVPSAVERRAAIERMAGGHRLVEGLFLAADGCYLVLVQLDEEPHDLLTLEGEPPLPVPRMAAASASRRMSHAAGVRLERTT